MVDSKTHGIEHEVRLRLCDKSRGDNQLVIAVTVTASTPSLACRMAEELPEFLAYRPKAVSVTTVRTIQTRCTRCGSIILNGEQTRTRGGHARCFDCA